MAETSKILIIGGTGYIGKFVVEASVKAGHLTYVLVRENTASNPDKAKIIDNFKNLGVNLVYGDIYDRESLVKAIKGVDVVISTVGHLQLADQTKIIAAIKEAGNVKVTSKFLMREAVYGSKPVAEEVIFPDPQSSPVIGEFGPFFRCFRHRRFGSPVTNGMDLVTGCSLLFTFFLKKKNLKNLFFGSSVAINNDSMFTSALFIG